MYFEQCFGLLEATHREFSSLQKSLSTKYYETIIMKVRASLNNDSFADVETIDCVSLFLCILEEGGVDVSVLLHFPPLSVEPRTLVAVEAASLFL